jgi:hypothetical protein
MGSDAPAYAIHQAAMGCGRRAIADGRHRRQTRHLIAERREKGPRRVSIRRPGELGAGPGATMLAGMRVILMSAPIRCAMNGWCDGQRRRHGMDEGLVASNDHQQNACHSQA